MILGAVAALSLCLGTAAPAKAQYYWQQYYVAPNAAYTFSYVNPGVYTYPSYYYGMPYGYGYNPYASYYPYASRYYYWNWYNPYTNQYRYWRWYRQW
jgi:hypothetical protein